MSQSIYLDKNLRNFETFSFFEKFRSMTAFIESVEETVLTKVSSIKLHAKAWITRSDLDVTHSDQVSINIQWVVSIVC